MLHINMFQGLQLTHIVAYLIKRQFFTSRPESNYSETVALRDAQKGGRRSFFRFRRWWVFDVVGSMESVPRYVDLQHPNLNPMLREASISFHTLRCCTTRLAQSQQQQKWKTQMMQQMKRQLRSYIKGMTGTSQQGEEEEDEEEGNEEKEYEHD